MIGITATGDYNKTIVYLTRLSKADVKGDIFSGLDRYGRIGVDALSNATPVDSRLTANSWGYRIIKARNRPGIEWYNTNVVDNIHVAILIQYGHATGTGGYVAGRDFINPAIQPIFDQIVSDVWREVTK
jgi:predicted Zn-dependent protease